MIRTPQGDFTLAAVADGVGGSANGAGTSRYVIETIASCINTAISEASDAPDIKACIAQAILACHEQLRKEFAGGMKKGGTTLAFALIGKPQENGTRTMYLVSIGDSYVAAHSESNRIITFADTSSLADTLAYGMKHLPGEFQELLKKRNNALDLLFDLSSIYLHMESMLKKLADKDPAIQSTAQQAWDNIYAQMRNLSPEDIDQINVLVALCEAAYHELPFTINVPNPNSITMSLGPSNGINLYNYSETTPVQDIFSRIREVTVPGGESARIVVCTDGALIKPHHRANINHALADTTYSSPTGILSVAMDDYLVDPRYPGDNGTAIAVVIPSV
jgi:hypothetical protein